MNSRNQVNLPYYGVFALSLNTASHLQGKLPLLHNRFGELLGHRYDCNNGKPPLFALNDAIVVNGEFFRALDGNILVGKPIIGEFHG